MNIQPDLNPQEQSQLDLLADELRQAVPEAKLNPDFEQRLQMRLAAQPWTLRSAMRSNRMLRVAAALLMITTVAGPVSALVLMFVKAESAPVSLEWLPPLPVQETASIPEPKADSAIPPLDSTLEEAFGLPWHQAVERSNRMALVIRQWQLACVSKEFSTPSPTPALMDWSQATVLQIQDEFERRCLLGISSPPPVLLAERIHSLGSGESAPSWLQAWQWVLQGPGVEAAEFFKR